MKKWLYLAAKLNKWRTLFKETQALPQVQGITEADIDAEITALNAMPDEAIDFSDSLPLSEEFWQNAIRNPFYKPTET